MKYDPSVVDCGIYRGVAWADVPLNYLFYQVNHTNRKAPFHIKCRAEVVRRYALMGQPDPWAKESDHEKANT